MRMFQLRSVNRTFNIEMKLAASSAAVQYYNTYSVQYYNKMLPGGLVVHTPAVVSQIPNQF